MRHRKTQTHWPSTQMPGFRGYLLEGIISRETAKLVDRMQSDWLSSNGAGHVIPSVLSSQFIILVDIRQAVMSHATLEI